jgi:hypothetical protein
MAGVFAQSHEPLGASLHMDRICQPTFLASAPKATAADEDEQIEACAPSAWRMRSDRAS